MTTETLYFLRDVLHDMTLNVSTPDFRHRARLVINALDELDEAIVNVEVPTNTFGYIDDGSIASINVGTVTPYGGSK